MEGDGVQGGALLRGQGSANQALSERNMYVGRFIIIPVSLIVNQYIYIVSAASEIRPCSILQGYNIHQRCEFD